MCLAETSSSGLRAFYPKYKCLHDTNRLNRGDDFYQTADQRRIRLRILIIE